MEIINIGVIMTGDDIGNLGWSLDGKVMAYGFFLKIGTLVRLKLLVTGCPWWEDLHVFILNSLLPLYQRLIGDKIYLGRAIFSHWTKTMLNLGIYNFEVFCQVVQAFEAMNP